MSFIYLTEKHFRDRKRWSTSDWIKDKIKQPLMIYCSKLSAQNWQKRRPNDER